MRSRFVAELRRLSGGRYHDLSPDRVAEAVRQVLGLPGAGIVMLHRLVRLPVGAAGERVPLAEQLQVTLGEGPCLASAACGQPLTATHDEMARAWPVYHRALVAQTPYRSTVSFPLRRGRQVFAALDVYGAEPEPRLPRSLEEVSAEVADLVAALLLTSPPDPADLLGPGVSEPLRQRQQVWVALGMVMEAASLDDLDALALLRAYAFRTGTLLDTVADRMAGGALRTAEVLDVG